MKNATTILSADWHIRGDRPVCRTDDYMEAQKKKIEFIQELAKDNQCPILIAGDVGHRPMWGDKLLNWFIEISDDFVDGYFAVAGQHDLPNHKLNDWEKAGLGVLDKSINNFNMLRGDFYSYPHSNLTWRIYPAHYSIGIYPSDDNYKLDTKYVLLLHQMVIKSQDDKLWYDQKADHAKRLLRKFPCYDLIVSGDNHQSFVVEHEGRLLVNAGSLMRMSANQIDLKPSVYLWYAEDNTVERVYLPIEEDVIDRSHIDVAKKRDSRIEAFVDRLDESYDIDFNFEKNLEEFFTKNKVNDKTKQKIWESLECQ